MKSVFFLILSYETISFVIKCKTATIISVKSKTTWSLCQHILELKKQQLTKHLGLHLDDFRIMCLFEYSYLEKRLVLLCVFRID